MKSIKNIAGIGISALLLLSGCAGDNVSEKRDSTAGQIKEILQEEDQTAQNSGNEPDDDKERFSEGGENAGQTDGSDEGTTDGGTSLPDKHKNVVKEVNGRAIIMNPGNILSVVNKSQGLPEDYTPGELVIPDVPFPFEGDIPKKYMRKEAAAALEEMFQEASRDGVHLMAISGYRTYERQKELFVRKAAEVGEEAANEVVAYPGESEHQTGLTMDVSSASFGYRLDREFGDTAGGKWVAKHAHRFGFIVRYPEGKEEITGYQYEPWHLRYVGKDAAAEINEQDMTLEEYMGLVQKQ
ncbi:M15 family metallopeptidase [Bacillus marinisedimentorum]|uniref:M15 family metallopeptidase n=1 Tax=Bacillus marinisedimentorum TaxID=1821260 RepID=UPI0007DE68A1|nr:M15 family metallopeptidase [Bacillus marinisedimentorum]